MGALPTPLSQKLISIKKIKVQHGERNPKNRWENADGVPTISGYNPFRTAISFWGQITQISGSSSLKWDCGPKRVTEPGQSEIFWTKKRYPDRKHASCELPAFLTRCCSRECDVGCSLRSSRRSSRRCRSPISARCTLGHRPLPAAGGTGSRVNP